MTEEEREELMHTECLEQVRAVGCICKGRCLRNGSVRDR